MARDPLPHVEDAPLFIVPRVLERLRAYQAAPKIEGLPAADIDGLLERLLGGIERHPTKFWVMKQFQQTLDAVGSDDVVGCRQVRAELEKLMDMLGIASSDGVLGAEFR
ncbi:DUF4844 domain-containing protein [Massilia sp. SYSU DXS3249]